jgi:glutamate/tyrosine decarboxylase-like PLP-dependent enzyme
MPAVPWRSPCPECRPGWPSLLHGRLYDSGIALVTEASALRDAMSISGAYLMPGERPDAMNVTPDSSRRARAVDMWAALKSMGRRGLSELVERNCRQAHHLAAALRLAMSS